MGRVTVAGFGPLLQRISTVIRTFDFLKSVADKLRADGRTSVSRASNTYSPVLVEGQGWDIGPASQTIGDEDVPGWGIFLIILIFFLILTPILCYYYARTKYDPDKAGIWLRYMCSHSNPTLPLLY